MCSFNLDVFEAENNYGNPNSGSLIALRAAGFKPIGITVMICEETFIFKGSAEAVAAGNMFLPDGWYYDYGSFIVSREKYVHDFYGGDEDIAPTVYWLDNNFDDKKL